MKRFVLAALIFGFTLTTAYSQSNEVEDTRLLAEQGDAYAQAYLAYMYDSGKGVPEDDAEAFKWYRLAANQGLSSGANNLGVMYAAGKGVHQDDLAAYVWFSVAAVQSYEGATKSRDEVAARLNAEQLELGQKLAKRCVESGYKDCDHN